MIDNRKKKLPIGIENFEKIRTEDFYYIDKTGFIRDLLTNWGEVNLFTRPRRFGKSLNMDMLKQFFEIGGNKEIFDGLEISKETQLCETYMGKFPVVSVSLKGIAADTYENARMMAVQVINREAGRLQALLSSEKLTSGEKEEFSLLLKRDMDDDILCCGLYKMSDLLQKHYGQKVIVLIDEYDVPLAKANERGYYDRMAMLIRSMFEQVLKTNSSLYFAVLTGCLRVAKESIFTGLNNLKMLSIVDVRFDEYFGFTDREVKELLEYYELSDSYGAVKDWYDGYHFGNVDVYCPWDVICYVDELRANEGLAPKNYWSNTSGNDVVRHFLEQSDLGMTKREIERLIAGEAVVKEIHQELTYKELYDSIDNIWSVLFTTGYLTRRGRPEGDIFQLGIPNMEIRKIFTGQIMKLFKEDVQKDGESVNAFCDALKNGDALEVEKQFAAYLRKTISIRDTFVRKATKENFYHGILLGILGFKESWGVASNKAAGDGYNDIQIEIDEEETGIIIEVKYAHSANLEAECKEALRQIDDRGYAQEFREEGITKILKYGIACYKKKCKVLLEEERV